MDTVNPAVFLKESVTQQLLYALHVLVKIAMACSVVFHKKSGIFKSNVILNHKVSVTVLGWSISSVIFPGSFLSIRREFGQAFSLLCSGYLQP